MLHVLNGDSAIEPFRRSGLPGKTAVWAELLQRGPIDTQWDPEHRRRHRARFYAENGWGDWDSNLMRLKLWDDALDRASDFEEVVLWHEADLFDQLLLIHHLDAHASGRLPARRLSLAQVGGTPDTGGFLGLGPIDPASLVELWQRRQPVSADQVVLGQRAWAAFASRDPLALEALITEDLSSLPCLAMALRRHLEDLPSTRNGLNRTENQAFALLADGPLSATTLFQRSQAAESYPYWGDSGFWNELLIWTKGPMPLIKVEPPKALGDDPLTMLWSLTSAGQGVRVGEMDAWKVVPARRQLGGVLLEGQPTWRWDLDQTRVIEITRDNLSR